MIYNKYLLFFLIFVSFNIYAKDNHLCPNLIGTQSLSIPEVVGEFFGEVVELNLRSPIKTITIQNDDENDPLQQLILVINDKTVIARKGIGEEEGMLLTYKALEQGQNLSVIYSRSETQTKALTITIQ